MPDRWDAEAREIAQQIAQVSIEHVRDVPKWCGREWCLNEEGECQVAAGAHHTAALARRAYREALERARGLALDVAGEYPEDIFRPIEPGELTNISAPVDRIGAHMARITARNIAATIRREIEGLDKHPESQADSPTP